jgi:hypothetical protein
MPLYAQDGCLMNSMQEQENFNRLSIIHPGAFFEKPIKVSCFSLEQENLYLAAGKQ